MKICKNCKAESSNEAKFCQECGYQFTENDTPVKVCKNCNTHNPETSKFCQECGKPLEIISVPAATNDEKEASADNKVTLGEKVENPSQSVTEDVSNSKIDVPASGNVSAVQEINKADEEINYSDPELKEDNNAESQSEKDVTVTPDIPLGLHQTETDSDVKEFNVSDILANDPYYNDVPLEDNGETKTTLDKENLKKAIIIIAVALIFVSAITAMLVATA